MIALTGGGTGGHLSIVKNLKLEFKNRDEEVIYIGSTRGFDADWFENDDDFSFKYFLPSRGFKQGIWNKLVALYFLLHSMFFAVKILKKHKITKVVSVGGFSASPASLMAILFRYDLYIHEQNSIIGRLNNLCKPYAKGFFCSFPQKNITLSPYPVSKQFFEHKRERKSLTTILFLGGSNGASFINELAISTAPFLDNLGIKIIHQSGSKDFDKVKKAYRDANINADVFSFSSSMYEKMEQADFAVSRAGASSFWELVSNGLPTMFIPYPYAIFNHQYHNAEFLSSKKLCLLYTQAELGNEKFCQEIGKHHKLNSNISNISVKLNQLNAENGAGCIVDCIMQEG